MLCVWNLQIFETCGGLNIVVLVMNFLLVPETKQQALEELDYDFEVPTRTPVKYQIVEYFICFVQWWEQKAKFETPNPVDDSTSQHTDNTSGWKGKPMDGGASGVREHNNVGLQSGSDTAEIYVP